MSDLCLFVMRHVEEASVAPILATLLNANINSLNALRNLEPNVWALHFPNDALRARLQTAVMDVNRSNSSMAMVVAQPLSVGYTSTTMVAAPPTIECSKVCTGHDCNGSRVTMRCNDGIVRCFGTWHDTVAECFASPPGTPDWKQNDHERPEDWIPSDEDEEEWRVRQLKLVDKRRKRRARKTLPSIEHKRPQQPTAEAEAEGGMLFDSASIAEAIQASVQSYLDSGEGIKQTQNELRESFAELAASAEQHAADDVRRDQADLEAASLMPKAQGVYESPSGRKFTFADSSTVQLNAQTWCQAARVRLDRSKRRLADTQASHEHLGASSFADHLVLPGDAVDNEIVDDEFVNEVLDSKQFE